MEQPLQPDQRGQEHVFALPKGSYLFEFEIEHVLGSGGFGITYLAYDTLLQEAVAIKEYLPNELAVRTGNSTVSAKSTADRQGFESGLKAFLEEARLLARIRDDYVVRVRRFFELHGTGYIVQDFESGTTLNDRLQQGRLAQQEIRDLLAGVLTGLEAVHNQAVLHRDLKPSNIMLRQDGTPVLIDFGAARDFAGRHSRSVTAIATPGYTPPEQFGAGGQQGPWTDIYALGGVLYRCVTGTSPVDSIRRLRNDPMVPATVAAAGEYDSELLSLVDWMLRIDETERPASVEAVRNALRNGPAASMSSRRRVIDSLNVKSVRPGHVLLELPGEVRADVLELAFFATPPQQYLNPSMGGKPVWRNRPHYFEISRTLQQDRGSAYEVGPEIVNAIPALAQITVSSADGFINATAAWKGVPEAGRSSRRIIAITGAIAALLLVFVGLGVALTAIDWRNMAALFQKVPVPDPSQSNRREALVRNEEAAYRAARNDIAGLQTYLKTCEICAFAVEARADIERLEREQRLQRARQAEDLIYREARGNLARLRAYVDSCSICEHAQAARAEIAQIEASRPPLPTTAPQTGSPIQPQVQTQTISNALYGLRGHTDYIRSIAVTPSGDRVATGSDDKTTRLWSISSGSLIRTFSGHSDYVRSVAISPDGQSLLSGSDDKSVRLWNLQTGRLTRSFTGHTDWVRAVAFAPDGRTILSGSDDRSVRVWNVGGGLVRSMTGHSSFVMSIAVTQAGRLAVSGSVDDTARVWDLQTGRQIHLLNGHTDDVNSVAIAPDGRSLITGSDDSSMKLWDLETGRLIRTFTGSSSVKAVAFVPLAGATGSGVPKYAVSGDGDGVKLWDLASGATLYRFTHSGVLAVSITADGRYLISGSSDHSAKIWQMPQLP